MTIDRVHDLQKAFRKLVTAHSFPGRLVNMASESSGIDTDLVVPPHMILPALILLDAETTFSIKGSSPAEAGRLIGQLTYADSAAAERAGFLFVDDDEGCRREALEEAFEGTLENPHLGATLILDLESFRSDDGAGAGAADAGAADAEDTVEWILSGPGIPGEKRLWTSGGAGWMDIRNSRNVEFPLGVDLLLVHSGGTVAALPRTTRIRRAGEEG